MGCAPITAFNVVAKMRGRTPMCHSSLMPDNCGIICKFDAYSVDVKRHPKNSGLSAIISESDKRFNTLSNGVRVISDGELRAMCRELTCDKKKVSLFSKITEAISILFK